MEVEPTLSRNFGAALLLSAHFCVGLASWLLLSGVFTAAVWELRTAPEGSVLFARLDAATQIPNILPVLLVLFAPVGWAARHSIRLSGALLLLGVVDGVFLTLASSVHTSTASVGLLVGASAGGVLGTTSMVCFFPFAASLGGTPAITALSAGVGACGLLAQLLAAARAASAYDTNTYFVLLTGTQLVGAAAFVLLVRSRSACSDTDDDDGGKLNADQLSSTQLPAAAAENVPYRVFPPPEVEPRSDERCSNACTVDVRRWLRRHWNGCVSAGWAPLLGVVTSCCLEFSMPGLLPFLCRKGDEASLFWLNALWNTSSILGRLLAAIRPVRHFALANALQAGILVTSVWWASRSLPPPFAAATVSIATFSASHGLIVTSAFVMAARKHVHIGPAYCGLANQCGALLGSLLTLGLVSSGLVAKQ